MEWIYVGIGSFIGGVLRYWISFPLNSRYGDSIPWGTLLVNFVGCLIIGILYSESNKIQLSPRIFLLATTGVLGGFTTFSTFSLEAIDILQSGQVTQGVVYVLLSLGSCLIGTFLGMTLMRLY